MPLTEDSNLSKLAEESKSKVAEVDEAKDNVKFTWSSIKSVLPRAWWHCFNLGSVYFFEYMIITSLTDRTVLRINEDEGDLGFVKKNVK